MIASFYEHSSEANKSMHFQGSTMFTPIITTPLVVAIPTGGTRTQSHPTVLKPKRKRAVRNLTAKNPKTTPTIHIVDLTDEVEQSVSTSLIVEEIPSNPSTIPPQS